jgi:tRNA-dihydrouridine synthase
MVARGAQGNPFIFREILQLINTGQMPAPPADEEKAAVLLRQAKLTVADKGEYLAMRQLRKHASWYLKGIKNAARFRDAAVKMNTLEDLKNLLIEVYTDVDIDTIFKNS